jgi:hypothetical protein
MTTDKDLEIFKKQEDYIILHWVSYALIHLQSWVCVASVF